MKKKTKKKKNPVITAFATSLIVSMAFFSAVFALNIEIVSEYFGKNPCVTGVVSRNPAKGSWNNKGDIDNPASTGPFQDYIENTVFIGDSRTYGFITYRFIKQENVFAEIGQSHKGARFEHFIDLGTGSLLTVAQAVGIKKPERMIVSYGINGIAYTGPQTFMNEYEALIDDLRAASPDSLIIIQSILPVSSYYQTYIDSRLTNEKIDSYNALLKQLAEEKDCRYLDTSGVLKDGGNCLSSEYDSGDGLHFNSRVYEVLLQYLDQHRIF